MRLVRATEAQKRARDALNYEAWGAGLSRAQYLEREAALRATPWAQAAMTTWLLEEEGEVAASCETLRMDSVLDGEAGVTYAFASVFTEARLRGRGHATELVRRVSAEVAPGAQALTLFSDVGAALYARCGFVARPAWDVVVPARAGDPAAVVDALLAPEALVPLPPPGERFLITPSSAQLAWHRSRDEAYARLLGRPRLQHAGARAGDGAIAWAADHLKRQLVVLDVAGDAALVEAARRVAHAHGLAEVVIWETPSVPAVEGAARRPRAGALPMIRTVAGFAPEDWRHVPKAVWV